MMQKQINNFISLNSTTKIFSKNACILKQLYIFATLKRIFMSRFFAYSFFFYFYFNKNKGEVLYA